MSLLLLGVASMPAIALDQIQVLPDDLGAPSLSGVRSIEFSPNGEHLYAAATGENAIVVLSREATSGELNVVQTIRDEVGGTNELRTAICAEISPDGSFVYAGAANDDALTVFSRDAGTGQLTLVTTYVDSSNGVDGLSGVWDIAISPNGTHLYTVAGGDDAVTAFVRDVATGELTFLAIYKDGVAGVDGLRNATGIALTSDGADVYAVGGGDDSLVHFSRDGATGLLTLETILVDDISGIDGLDGAQELAISGDDAHIYVTSLIDNKVAAFERDLATGGLTFLQVYRTGVDGVEGLASNIGVSLSSDGSNLYVAGSGFGAVVVFERDPSTGLLTFVEVHYDNVGATMGLEHVVGVAVSPDGEHVYAAAAVDDALTAFERNVGSGMLTFVQEVRDGASGTDGLDGPGKVAASADGLNVYVSSSIDDGVAAFERDPVSGTLSFLASYEHGESGLFGLDGANSVAVSSDGRNVYATAVQTSSLVVFSRDPALGTLQFTEEHHGAFGGEPGLNTARDVAVSPDGGHVYTVASGDHAVNSWLRDAVDGSVTRIQTTADNQGGVDGLGGAHAVAISPDGQHVYVAGRFEDEIAIFGRNPTTGVLSFIGIETEGLSAGGPLLYYLSDLVVSPDGSSLYATGEIADAVTVFSRNPVTGMLAFLETHEDGVAGVNGLEGAGGVDVSPDGRQVVVISRHDGAVALFARDQVSGLLSFEQAVSDGGTPEGGTPLPAGIAFSPDGAHVYASRGGNDVIGVYRNALCGDSFLSSGEECDDGGVADGDCCSATCAFEAFGTICAPDGEICTVDVCDSQGICTHPAGNAQSICRATADQCDQEERCDGILPACPGDGFLPDGTTCEDGQGSTFDDVCLSGVCVGYSIGCPTMLDNSCLSGFGKGLLKIRGGDPDRRQVKAKLLKGPELGQSDLGNPLVTAGTIVSLCIYNDQSILVGEFEVDRAGATCAGRACWSAIGKDPPDGKGYRYKDRNRSASGVERIIFKGGPAGRSKASIVARGSSVPGGIASSLSSTANATIQLRGDDSPQCLSYQFTDIVRQEPDSFKAR